MKQTPKIELLAVLPNDMREKLEGLDLVYNDATSSGCQR